MAEDKIKIKGAREHNLKNISVEFPKNSMVVFTGVSGSGKSSLAFDTLFSEGQRRYIESLSAYARQFLNKLDKPDVDEIRGLSPAISIDQKSHSANPRSTVATVTEIYDYLRVLYARTGTAYCPICGDKIQKMSVDEIVDAGIDFAGKRKEGKSMVVMAPVVLGRKGEYYQLLYDLLNAGFSEVRIDGEFYSLRDRIQLGRYKQHTIEVVTDRINYGVDFSDRDNRLRLNEAVEEAVRRGRGIVKFVSGGEELLLSNELSCPKDNFSFPEIEPRLFSFNSPYGACPDCHGLGIEKGTGKVCESCRGKRLRPASLSVLLEGKNISEVTQQTIEEAEEFFKNLQEKTDEKFGEVAAAPLREIRNRLKFLLDVGLNYLTLDRSAGSLSGGEAQRIRLASQIGSQLTGTLYILDEPTIGLHQRDNDRLIKTLKYLRDLGNTIIVVEHDEQTIRESDYMVDIGSGPGIHGGEIVAQGRIPEVINDKENNSLTLDYLRGDKKVEVPKERRKVGRRASFLKVKDASTYNLKNIDVNIPLRKFVALTGVSGSGKSTLMVDVLHRELANRLNGTDYEPASISGMQGLEYLSRVVNIDQSPIGRTPRSNPVTYTGAWDYIRDLFVSTEEARVRGYRKGRFSFNVPGGRCENCEGHGTIAIEMHFLPTVYVTCSVCHGRRYNRETLEVKYKGKNVAEVLEMTVEEAREFFSNIPWLDDRLGIMQEVGLGYLKLGQPAPTLSGGEAQRIKLAKELGKRSARRTIYLLDEPTTGLHFEDVKKLVDVLQKLVNRGNTVMVIEHNPEVIKSVDWLIDLGPEGGEKGGRIVAQGKPEDVSKKAGSPTGQYLKRWLKYE